ncbi:aminotransferase-like domain-containing protein [Paucidesulfovibrio longus]|uniref:aminotransferase-like domain-containing protein n=1 Tax=Paucidesulfovibrio longus TaxID=889 RepID=UPI0003B71E94|nr:PLP-dependent aminotransferase family protein [Paucidesulfovibrio longus]
MTIWNPLLESGGPKYLALADALERDVASGELRPGQRLPTHRELADQLGLNVTTVTRGYRAAEQRGLVSGTVGRGTFVSSDAAGSSAIVSLEPHLPGTVEMGLITPLYHLDPDVSEGMRRVLARRDPAALMRYGDPRGLPEHRAAGADWASRYGLEASPDNVLVCAGAQHALACCLSGLLRPGERIAVDALTYPGVKTLAAQLGLRLAPVEMDAGGMLPEALDAACRREEIKGLYLMPGVHNPTSVRMSERRRDRIAETALRHGLTVIEDDAYDLTAPDRQRPVAARLPETGVYVAGLSKALAPGLRVAFLAAPKRLVPALAGAVLNTVWMAPPLSVELAAHWIKDGTADRTVAAKRTEAARRMRIAEAALAGQRFSAQPSGYFLWLELPGAASGAQGSDANGNAGPDAGWTGREFEARAREAGVSLFGAERFTVGDARAPRAVRLSLTGPADDRELRRGLGVVVRLLEEAAGSALPEPATLL